MMNKFYKLCAFSTFIVNFVFCSERNFGLNELFSTSVFDGLNIEFPKIEYDTSFTAEYFQRKQVEKAEASIEVAKISNGLPRERLKALLSKRVARHWSDKGKLLELEAAVLGIDKSVLHGALLWILRKKKSEKIDSLSIEEIKVCNKKLLKINRFQSNCHILARLGLTDKTCQEKALELGVTWEELDAYRKHLLHNTKLHEGYVFLNPGDIRAFYTRDEKKYEY